MNLVPGIRTKADNVRLCPNYAEVWFYGKNVGWPLFKRGK